MKKVNEFEYGVDDLRGSKQRFSDESNKHYRFPEEEKLIDSPDTILDFVKHHLANQKPRLDVLDRYYEGYNTAILKKERRKEKDLADHRAVHNFADYISTFIQGYMVGIPLKTEYVDPEENDDEEIKNHTINVNNYLRDLNRANEADEHNSELVLDQSIYGRAYELVYRNNEDIIRYVRLDPLDTFVIYDVKVTKRPVAGVSYYEDYNDSDKMNVTVYTRDRVVQFVFNRRKDTDMVLVNNRPHYLGDVPIIEYENNSKRTGDFEKVLTLIDLYDSAQSDLANYSQDLNDALLKIRGYLEMKKEDAKNMKDSNILYLKPAIKPDGTVGEVDAEYIYKKYDVQGMEAYKTRLQNDIFLISNVPNLLDDSFSGTQSGEALKMKLFGLSQKRATKERKFKKALRQRYRLIKNNLGKAAELDFDVENLQITFTENLPRAVSQEVKWFTELGGKLSEETMLSLLSFIENPKEEIAKIEAEERKREADRNPPLDFQGFLNGNEEGADDANDRTEQTE